MHFKARTSTQHAYTKLLVVVAIFIWTNGVVANSTSEPVGHRRRLSVAAVRFKEKWSEAFRDQVRQHYDDTINNNVLSDGQLNKVWEKVKDFKAFPTSKEEYPQLTKGKSKIFLLPRPLEIKGRNGLAKETLEVLKVVEDNRISDVVKILNAAFMRRILLDHQFARNVESELLKQLSSEGKSLGALFGDLKLNEMKNEMELYSNPAFTTWMKYAFHLHGNDPVEAFGSMLTVLNEQKLKPRYFKDIVKAPANLEKKSELFRKWDHIYAERLSWYDYLPKQKFRRTSELAFLASLHDQ